MNGLIIIIVFAILIVFIRNRIYNSDSQTGRSLLFIGDVYTSIRFIGSFIFLIIFLLAIIIFHKIKGK